MTGRSDADIETDLAVPPATILQAATHQVEHGHIHCQCPARLWTDARDRLARDVEPLLARAQQAEAEVRLLSARAESMAHLTRDRNNWRDAALAAKQHYEQSDERIDRLRAELAEARAENERLRDACWTNAEAMAERDALAAKVQAVEAFRDRVRDERAAVEYSRDAGDNSGGARDYAQGAIDALRRVDGRITAALAADSSEPEDGPNDGYDYPMRVTEDLSSSALDTPSGRAFVARVQQVIDEGSNDEGDSEDGEQ